VIEKEHWGDAGVNERIILRWIFSIWNVVVWTGKRLLMIGTVGGDCKCGNETWGSIKYEMPD
jgi:hypothetical protein